eukprot:Gb_08713 [translate_table: standard]
MSFSPGDFTTVNLAESKRYTRAHPDPEGTPFLPNLEKLLTKRNKQLKELSTSSSNLAFEEVVFLEFEFKEDFQVLETPIKSPVDSILGKGKVLSDLEGSVLSFSEGRPWSKPAIVSSPRKPITPKAKNLILQHLMAHHNPPPPPPRVNPWVQPRYGPLRLPVNLHDMPDNYLKILPKFDGEKNVLAEDHMIAFQDFTDNMFIEHDDVYMRRFVQTLEGNMTASEKIKPRSDSGEKDKKKQKEEGGPSTSYAESQDINEEPNDVQRRINQLVEMQQSREQHIMLDKDQVRKDNAGIHKRRRKKLKRKTDKKDGGFSQKGRRRQITWKRGRTVASRN